MNIGLQYFLLLEKKKYHQIFEKKCELFLLHLESGH
jgi:hypothetical protein